MTSRAPARRTGPFPPVLTETARKERLLEKLLERGARGCEASDTRFRLLRLARQCREHARILDRHRRDLSRGRQAGAAEGPHWERGEGPRAAAALAEAREVAATLAKECRSLGRLAPAVGLRKWLEILAEEHGAQWRELDRVIDGVAGVTSRR